LIRGVHRRLRNDDCNDDDDDNDDDAISMLPGAFVVFFSIFELLAFLMPLRGAQNLDHIFISPLI
jgi:hypothetical protein